MRRLFFSICIGTALIATDVSAETQDFTNPASYACDGKPENALIQEGVLQLGTNHFGASDQQIISLGYTRSECATFLGQGRFYIEGVVAAIKEEPSTAAYARAGIGYSYRFATEEDSSLTISPIVNFGYANRSNGNNDVIAGGRMDIAWTKSLDPSSTNDTTSFNGTNLVVFLQPAYTLVVPAHNQPLFLTKTNASFSFSSSVGVDIPSSFRIGDYDSSFFRISLGNQYIDTDAPTTTISSLVLAFRPVNSANEYKWNFNLYLSTGNGGYRGVALGITSRL